VRPNTGQSLVDLQRSAMPALFREQFTQAHQDFHVIWIAVQNPLVEIDLEVNLWSPGQV